LGVWDTAITLLIGLFLSYVWSLGRSGRSFKIQAGASGASPSWGQQSDELDAVPMALPVGRAPNCARMRRMIRLTWPHPDRRVGARAGDPRDHMLGSSDHFFVLSRSLSRSVEWPITKRYLVD
jgi:hypothetical protein